MIAFELAVQDAAGVAVAASVGADRMELCAALGVGGLTPSRGLTALAVESGVPVHVLVRPRAGGFVYDDVERALIVADVRAAVTEGAAGVVIGGIRDGRPDERLVDEVREAASGREITFHRAFDQLGATAGALEALVALGVDRILTSGGASRAEDGLAALSELSARAAGRIQIMAGAGITSANVQAVLATGVHAVHASAKRWVADAVAVRLGSDAPAGRGGHETLDPEEARALRAAISGEAG